MSQPTDNNPDRYEPASVESRWQERWKQAGIFQVPLDKSKPKYYVLEMFPYPSGRIHMGHCPGLHHRRRGGPDQAHAGQLTCCTPMGWDAFGMPAENAAIAHHTHPATWTYSNIDNMRSQLQKLGYSLDWEREFATCDPSYYRWEQLMFLKMWERDMVYRKMSLVNWCESCQTVLANEQVEQGRCWRCRHRGEPARNGRLLLPHHRLRGGAAGVAGTRCPAGRSGC